MRPTPGNDSASQVLHLSGDELNEVIRRAAAIAAARLAAADDDGKRDGIEAATRRRREIVDGLFEGRHEAFRNVAVLVSFTVSEFHALGRDTLGLWMQTIAAQAAFALEVACVVPDGGDHHLDPREKRPADVVDS